MKTLLIRPATTFYLGAIRPVISIPVGLHSIAAVLERAGFAVKIYDAQMNTTVPISKENGALLMGDSWQVVEQKLGELNFNLVGISCQFSARLPNAIRLAAIIRKLMPQAIIKEYVNRRTSRIKISRKNTPIH